MPKLEAKYVPIGTKLEEKKVVNTGKSLKELEEEAKAVRKKPVADIKKSNKSKQQVKSELLSKQGEKIKLLESLTDDQVQTLSSEKDEVDLEPEKLEEELDLFDPTFLENLSQLEIDINNDIKNGKIKLIITNADQNLNNIENSFDEVFTSVASNVNYQIKDEKAIHYSQEVAKAESKLERLEQTIDQLTYQSELRLNEFEESKLRETRYRKRKFEGLDEIGGIQSKDHRTDEKNLDIDLKKNTDFSDEYRTGLGKKKIRERQGNDVVERRAFSQDYDGSDLEGIDKERDRLEQEILKKQEAKEKANKKNSKKKTEEEKIAEAKERLRKKQEKRKAKQQSKQKAEEVGEIDLVGNQFDVDELREERMDRLLEIKRLSAEKKELQKQKEKQRSKATKEFYKYKKVNKKSHIVGFKQQ